ncbi:hypothetical protein [Thermotalea metallivorans]|uniref:hypothetical protein n=1 Tax=Thermotalea metallivorans TaxID=520762 RepID=UPI0012EDE835|nr:hypothetical protein [Thermotalea metallivorans]
MAVHKGMKTFFVEDNIIHREDMEIKADGRENCIDLLKFFKVCQASKKESTMNI